MRRPIFRKFLTALAIFLASPPSWAETDKILETKYATIHYAEDQDVGVFFWRLSGQRVDFLTGDTALIKNRLEELVERVERLLEMYPASLHFTIALKAKYEGGNIAEYSHRTRVVTVALDRVTDGILAHEMAHAVINAYFSVPPPEKAQEILAQYVDKHLYEEPL